MRTASKPASQTGAAGQSHSRAYLKSETRSGLNAIELPNPYEIVLTTTNDERVELPWDFIWHYCDQTYRPRMELIAAKGKQVLGARVRALRETAA